MRTNRNKSNQIYSKKLTNMSSLTLHCKSKFNLFSNTSQLENRLTTHCKCNIYFEEYLFCMSQTFAAGKAPISQVTGVITMTAMMMTMKIPAINLRCHERIEFFSTNQVILAIWTLKTFSTTFPQQRSVCFLMLNKLTIQLLYTQKY